ncbi:unnamed protein product, partial [Nesidiocoris tenuis]
KGLFVQRDQMNKTKLNKQKKKPAKNQYTQIYMPPSSSESDMKVSCIASGATTRYFSSVVTVVVVVIVVSVTTLSVSTTVMYPSLCAIASGVRPCCNDTCNFTGRVAYFIASTSTEGGGGRIYKRRKGVQK